MALFGGYVPKRVLVLDNDLELLGILSGIVGALGHGVVASSDVGEAMREHSSSPFDVILVEVDDDGIDGGPFVRWIREGAGCPFVAVMSGMRDVTLAGLDVDFLLLKTFGAESVRKVVDGA
jgi:DNA-binding response OmpR family regulator